MTIETINGYTATTATTQVTGENTLGKDEFLNLLVTQLQYQDPLNPMDSTDFTAQLAQFSSLEQLSNLNGKFDQLARSQEALNNTQAVSYIGRSILAEGNTVDFDGEQPVACHFDLDDPSAETYVNVYDATGAFVRSFDAGPMALGARRAAWDGRDQNGNMLSAGTYYFEVAAVDGEGASVNAHQMATGTVTGVTYEDGDAYVVAGGREIAVKDIRRVTVLETN